MVIILVSIILLLLSMTSLKIRLQYRRQGSDDYFSVELSLWRGLISYKLEVPVVETEIKHGLHRRRPLWPRALRPAFKIEAKVMGKNDPEPVRNIKEENVLGLARILSKIKKSKRFFENYMPAIRFFLSKVYLRHFQWRTEFGMEEPHLTGFLVGLAGGVKGLLLSRLYRVIQSGAARPLVVITPQFEKPCFVTHVDCEFDVKVGHIFLTGLKFVLS